MGTPDTIHVIEKIYGNTPVIAVNKPADGIRMYVKGSGDPVYLQIDSVPES